MTAPSPRNPKAEFLAEFSLFANLVFPDVTGDSAKYTSLRRTYLAGALSLERLLHGLGSDESREWSIEVIEALYELADEEGKLPSDPKAN